MSEISEVIGNEEILNHFKNAICLDKVSHAYIINGENGMGKNTLADIFAMSLQCENGSGEPCKKCHSCLQAISSNHPDIIRISHEKPNSIGIDEIREQLNNDITIRPYSGKYKIYIIDEAHKMTAAAQNALLKTIEEPPEYALILLLSENTNAFLPTILSRCIVLNIRPIDDKIVKKYLMERLQVPDYQAEIIATFAGGNIGKAIALSASEEFNELKKDVVHLMKYIEEIDAVEIIDEVKHLSLYKTQIYNYMDLMVSWYRDVLLYKATQDINALIFKDEYAYISSQASKISYNGVENILKAIDKAKIRLKANVNFDLCIELMFLEIKDNIL